MLKERFFINEPINFKNKFKIFAPTIREIITNEDFSTYRSILTLSQEDIEDALVKYIDGDKFPTPFEFLLSNAFHSKDYEKKAIEAFSFFIHQPVTFLYEKKMILIGNVEDVLTEVKTIKEMIFLSEEEFFEFQNLIRNSLGEASIEAPVENENPRIKKMKAKARYRDRIKAKQGKGLSFEGLIKSICCMGIGINPLNIGDLTYAAAVLLLETYQKKEKYETDLKLIVAGADSKKIKPKYWIN